jgi:pimeloyl-ACP methyl ester carboxylesterase
MRYATLERDGGRILEYLVAGAEAADAIVLHHGTPSDASLWESWNDACATAGLRMIALSRAGYGNSARAAGRSVCDAAADVAAVLDAQGVDEFVTAGWSGGGPHALACGALLAPRCRAVATFAGVGAYGAPDLDFLDGMGPENHEEFGAALQGEASVRAWLEANASDYRTVTAQAIADAFGGLVSQVDRDALADGFAEASAATMRRSLANGFDGWVDDDMAFVRPWGFDLRDVRVPVTVWQGDQDFMVPRAHGTWLAAKLPEARLAYVPGEGHISLLTRHSDRMVAQLRAAL